MKKLLLFAMLFAALSATAQIPGVSVQSYTTKFGTVVHKGDTLHLGMGKADNGSFRYAYIPANGWIGTPQVALNSSWNRLNPVVKDIRAQKTVKNMTPRTVVVIATGGINACVDFESAEEIGEVLTQNNGNITPGKASVSTSSVADELIKLKGLLDAGAITQDEFNQQKSKLLKP